MLGKLLQGRYQIVQVLSIRMFCQTYLAQDTHLSDHPKCVVKHFRVDDQHPESLQTLKGLFHREVQALKKLGNYDKAPKLLAYFEDNQEFYLVQEFIVGHPLTVELHPDHHWTESQVIQLLQEVLGILEFIHSQGLIHRDIKPSNLIRRQQDNCLVLIDFGSAKQTWMQVVTAQGQTNSNFALGIPATVIGTPGYMPSEQGRGRPRPNSDIYALGIIAIQALTGLNPTQLLEDADTGEFLWPHQVQVSDRLAHILNKMVQDHFKDRYQSAEEVLQALQLLIVEAEDKEEAEVLPSPYFPAPHRPALVIGILTGVASTLALIVGSYYFPRLSAPSYQVRYESGGVPSKNNSLEISLANTLTGHTNTIWSVALSPDRQTLVSSSGDKTIKIWNLHTGELRNTLTGHENMVLAVAISPDGKTLASTSWDKTVKIWNLQTGQLRSTLSEPSKENWSVAMSPDEQILVSSSGDINKIWNLGTEQLLHNLSGHLEAVWAVAISPDGQTLVSGSKDKTIKIWNLRTGQLRSTLTGHSGRVRSVAISADGQTLASGSWDKTIKIWNLRTGELRNTLYGHSGYVNTVAISPNGQILASGSDDRTIKLWNLRTGKLLCTLAGHSGNVNAVAFDADGKRLVSGSGDMTIKIWRLYS